MNWRITPLILLTALIGLAISGIAIAEDAASDEKAADASVREAAIAEAIEADTKAARAILKRSADFLADQERFGFTAVVSYDVLQANGQKLEFGATRDVTIRRPDRLRIDGETRDGDRRSVYFDGDRISIDLPGENAYVVVDKPGTLDAAVDYLVDDLNTPSPLHDFYKSNFYADVRIRSGYVIGMESVGKRRCEHLAFRTAVVDVQFWIEEGDRPLPCSLVITYRREAESPQFKATFEGWDLSPEVSDRVFAYAPPDGAERLSLQAVVRELRETAEGE